MKYQDSPTSRGHCHLSFGTDNGAYMKESNTSPYLRSGSGSIRK